MSAIQRLQVLGSAGRHDICSGCARSVGKAQPGSHFSGGLAGRHRSGIAANRPPKYDGMIYQASTPGGCVQILKTLLTNDCGLDCKYCANPVSQNRVSMEPQELARIFHGLWRRGRVKGLFLSSAIKKDPDFSMQRIIECARLVREKYSFGGYVHLKVLPGASKESVRMAAEFADRLSINLESPSIGILSEIAPSKDYNIDLLRRQEWIADMQKQGFLKSGHTTQFIVGASGESDREILGGLVRAYERTGIRRGYFSAFEPVPKTPLEKNPAVPKSREFRLYQTDWLLRVYKFELSMLERAFDEKGFLPNEDPKVLLAREFLGPVDANTDPYGELIKVPGIGPKTARNIIISRTGGSLDRRMLAGCGVILRRALPFLDIGGRVQSTLRNWN